MKKSIFVSLFFLTILGLFIYTMNSANKKIDNFFLLHNKISNVVYINKNFDLFMTSSKNYNNFDEVQLNIKTMKNELASISKNRLFTQFEDTELTLKLEEITLKIEKKIVLLNRIISKSAVLNNSYRYVQKLGQNIRNKEILKIYSMLLELDLNPEVDIKTINALLNEYLFKTKEEELFIVHAKIVSKYYAEFNNIKEMSNALKISEDLNLFEEHFTRYSNQIMFDLKNILWFLMIGLFFVLLAFLYYMHEMTMRQIELNRFKKAIQESDNIVLITDKNHAIKYVNQAFERITGYSSKEVMGARPSFLKSHRQPKSFYEELNNTINSGQKWQGEFINKNKNGSITYEKASITPILNEKGQIVEFLAIKLDITQEKETLRLLDEKEHILSRQSKMIAMREMLESIAHQWRQPLSTISTAASGLKLEKEFDTLNDEEFYKFMDIILENTLNLSNTIDNFKNYFNTKNEKTVFNLEQTIKKVIDLVGYRLNDEKIEVIIHVQSIQLEGLENELMQSLVNIITNSHEALIQQKVDKKFIFIDIYKEDKKVVILIKDNANGVEEHVLEHVFEPYFTTKHQSSGTGIGLHMVHEIITKHFGGSVMMENQTFSYDNKTYKGATTIIELPLK